MLRGIPSSYGADSAAPGDFDGDGKVDLLVSNNVYGLLVLPGNGAGAFQDGQSIPSGARAAPRSSAPTGTAMASPIWRSRTSGSAASQYCSAMAPACTTRRA